ncbi:MAG: RagB/SusD family nutrient uptake outer membrane protein, partial [Bacteroidaceae bacterium]|nr:RagB/SusD family nutrient uptake outer membrane protein [Bacteroidaceae bacterium]
MKKTIYILVAGLMGTFSLASCSDWLDVTPNTDVPAKELFTTENGYMSALAGLYISMTDENTYGKNLSFGLMEQLAQMYDKLPEGTSDRNSVYIYSVETSGAYNTKGVLANVWGAQYNLIANANNLLKWWELNGEVVLTDSVTRSMIRGEALALRAFLHFDLLRGWGPMNYAGDESARDMKCIPYRTVADHSKQPLLPAKEVVANIIGDLKEARECLDFEKDLDLGDRTSSRH